MKIAQVAPLYETVPPKGYGGTERVVSWLTEALVKKGHDVTLFACKGSNSSAKMVLFRDQPIRTDEAKCAEIADHLVMLQKVRDMAGEFDIIHFHTEWFHMPLFQDIAHKTVTTLHGRQDLKGLSDFYDVYNQFPIVSISDYQRRPLPYANYVKTVYHGLPKNTYRAYPENGQDYAAFLGRFSPEKAPHAAINIAQGAGMQIRMAAKICRQFAENKIYYQEEIKPRINNMDVQYIGEIDDGEKNDFLGNARALLFPINWPEPFGLVMIEAMACGTPTIAFRSGSVPEVIDNGITGAIVSSEDEAIAALPRVLSLDRRKIRRRFEQRFTATRMAKEYVELYHSLVSHTDAESELRTVASPDLMTASRP